SYKFEPEEGVQAAVRRCAREQLDTAIYELHDGIRTDPVEAVHNARKAIKKERALLRLVRGALDSGQRSHENQALRTAGRELSGVRDAEVQIQTLDHLSERFAGQIPESTVAAARAELKRRRVSEQARLIEPVIGAGSGGGAGSAIGADAAQRLAGVL